MSNRTRNANDQVSTSSTKSRESSRQHNTSIKEMHDNRLKEKKEMQSLNDRLANYFIKVRELEKEKESLLDQIATERDTCDKKIEEFRIYYENQLDALRVKLDIECQNSAKKSLDFEKHKLLAKNAEKEQKVLASELERAEKKISVLQADLNKCEIKYSNLNEEAKQLRKLVENLEQERNALDQASKKNLAQAESENLRAISLEGKLKHLEEQIISQKHFYEKELEEVRLRAEEERDEQIEEALDIEREALRTELMMTSRRKMEENVSRIRQELERQHADELNALREQLHQTKTNEKSSRSKLSSLQALIDKLNAKVNDLNQNETRLNNAIAELQSQLELERTEKIDLFKEKDREIRALEEELNSKDSENQLMAENNVQLKEEIQIYRNLMDEQEKSHEELSVSSSQRVTRASSPATGRRYVQATRKRRRTTTESINETSIINKSIGPIVIDDSLDDCIKLVNKSTEPVALGGWELKRENDDGGFAFKFHKSVVVQPNAKLTVYSVDAPDAVHNPPTEIKMKKNWPVGGITTLSNANKEVIATWELSFNSKRARFNTSLDDANKNCSIM